MKYLVFSINLVNACLWWNTGSNQMSNLDVGADFCVFLLGLAPRNPSKEPGETTENEAGL